MASFLRSWWASLVMLIALLLVLERAGGFSTVLGSVTNLATSTVKAFR